MIDIGHAWTAGLPDKFDRIEAETPPPSLMSFDPQCDPG